MASDSSGSAVTPMLDHIVILVDHSYLLNIDEHLGTHFTIAPGGTHADGLTWNRLILFQDGVYIELIAFFDSADPGKRAAHRWGTLQPGTIIDWACTLPHESQFSTVQDKVRRSGTGYSYADPVSGGRVRPDGVVLEWAIGAARTPSGKPTAPGELPFWCLDRTRRELRVPYESDKEMTQHPCGAVGVSRLLVDLPSEMAGKLDPVYAAIYGSEETRKSDSTYRFHVPSGSAHGKQSIAVGQGDKALCIKLALAGSRGSPSFVELLPDLVVKIE
ncbi:hypothetical protein K4F52_004435 [Lecanicillium sp. MT-2017a]|nr:hypothetical protein K4F52_004435 [Lecanicillium sp. MT-2017a]